MCKEVNRARGRTVSADDPLGNFRRGQSAQKNPAPSQCDWVARSLSLDQWQVAVLLLKLPPPVSNLYYYSIYADHIPKSSSSTNRICDGAKTSRLYCISFCFEFLTCMILLSPKMPPTAWRTSERAGSNADEGFESERGGHCCGFRRFPDGWWSRRQPHPEA